MSLEEKRMGVLALALTPALFSAPLAAECCNRMKDLLNVEFTKRNIYNIKQNIPELNRITQNGILRFDNQF